MKSFTKLELTHVSGSLETHDYTVQDKKGNFFTFVPGDEECDSFYVSTFEISKNPDTGEPQSVPGFLPWVDVYYKEAEIQAKKLGGALLSNKQYYRIHRYWIETGAVAKKDLYKYFPGYNCRPMDDGFLTRTGSNPNWRHNGIADFMDNTSFWIKEERSLSKGEKILCFLGFYKLQSEAPGHYRKGYCTVGGTVPHTGIRVALDCSVVA